MSLARWSASALHSAANAGSADMDLIRSNENSRSRLVSKSASMRSSTFVSFAASDISDLPWLARLTLLYGTRGETDKDFASSPALSSGGCRICHPRQQAITAAARKLF